MKNKYICPATLVIVLKNEGHLCHISVPIGVGPGPGGGGDAKRGFLDELQESDQEQFMSDENLWQY